MMAGLLQIAENAVLALADFSDAIKRDKNRYEAYERRSEVRKGNVLFNDALNTFYLRLYGVGSMVKD